MNIKGRSVKLAVIFVLVTVMANQFGGLSILAKNSDGEKTTLIAASDFQSTNAEDSARKLGIILDSVKENGGISSADGFLFCGDYSKTDRVLKDTANGVKQLKSTVSGLVDEKNIVLAQGNHDSEIGSAGMSESGNNDPESKKYGVFVINEDDYMWCNSDEQRIIETSRALKEYLDDKLEAKFQAPIFIASHLPLHVSMRTKSIGDGKHANYIFDVLNEAGAQGLNIVFLFGHNHGDGWDDYLGGSSVYLAKGDDITVAHGSMSNLQTKKLNFYYMNAGYVGYYSKCNDGAETSLTVTTFVFDSESMEIARYDFKGLHVLKASGVINAYKGEDKANLYSANTDVYQSPQKIKLNLFSVEEASTETADGEAQQTELETDAPKTETEALSESKGGCGAGVSLTSVVLVSAIAALLPLTKRKNRQ